MHTFDKFINNKSELHLFMSKPQFSKPRELNIKYMHSMTLQMNGLNSISRFPVRKWRRAKRIFAFESNQLF